MTASDYVRLFELGRGFSGNGNLPDFYSALYCELVSLCEYETDLSIVSGVYTQPLYCESSFTSSVNSIRYKWDSINKILLQPMSERSWAYFYATHVVFLRDILKNETARPANALSNKNSCYWGLIASLKPFSVTPYYAFNYFGASSVSSCSILDLLSLFNDKKDVLRRNKKFNYTDSYISRYLVCLEYKNFCISHLLTR